MLHTGLFCIAVVGFGGAPCPRNEIGERDAIRRRQKKIAILIFIRLFLCGMCWQAEGMSARQFLKSRIFRPCLLGFTDKNFIPEYCPIARAIQPRSTSAVYEIAGQIERRACPHL